MLGLLKRCVAIISEQRVLFVLLNWLFFGTMLLTPFFAPSQYVEPNEKFFNDLSARDNMLLAMLNIFFFNLLVSAFALVTLTGFLFFGIPVVFLLIRAWLWGALLNCISTTHLLIALPTLVLEGEGYVLATLAGVSVGLSWLKPQWVFKEKLSRLDAFKRALREFGYIYVLVVIFLFAAAIVETMTLVLIG
jgi:hypothetical protein